MSGKEFMVEKPAEQILYLEEGKPLVFGKEKDKGVRLNGLAPELVTIGETVLQRMNFSSTIHVTTIRFTILLSQLVHPQFPTPSGSSVLWIDPPMKTLCNLKSTPLENPKEKETYKPRLLEKLLLNNPLLALIC